MTLTNRHRSISNEKTTTSNQDDAPESQTGVNGSGVKGPKPKGALSRSFFTSHGSTVFYIMLIGAAGFTALYLQKIPEEVRQTNTKLEKMARKSADMSTKLDSIVLQVGGKSSCVKDVSRS